MSDNWDKVINGLVDMAEERIKGNMPTDVLIGTVTSVKPLKIRTQDGHTLEGNIMVSEKVTNHYVELIADPIHQTVKKSSTEMIPPVTGNPEFVSHDHDYKGGRFWAKYGLKKNDIVWIIRFEKGQRYIVADRIGNINNLG